MISFAAKISGKALENIHSKGDWNKAKECMKKEIEAIPFERDVKFTLSVSLNKLKGFYLISQDWAITYPKGQGWEVPESVKEQVDSIIKKYREQFNIECNYIESAEHKELMRLSELARQALRKRFGEF